LVEGLLGHQLLEPGVLTLQLIEPAGVVAPATATATTSNIGYSGRPDIIMRSGGFPTRRRCITAAAN
jgi:hypothetical protein